MAKDERKMGDITSRLLFENDRVQQDYHEILVELED